MDIAVSHDSGTEFDVAIAGGDLLAEDGLETAVLISLFSDRRAEPDDELPDGTGDRRGWWADVFLPVDGDRIGSRLWLLERAKQRPDVPRRAEEFMAEALAWLVEDGIAAAVEPAAETGEPDVLEMQATIRKPGPGDDVQERFQFVWEGL